MNYIFFVFLGCSKCVKLFKRKKFGDKQDCSGFEENESRLQCDHMTSIEVLKKTENKSELRSLEAKFGMRYSCLTQLPYFEVIRLHTIDPMHNLLLGTAKHVTQLWINSKVITQDDLAVIQSRVNKIKVPVDLGRIPSKIECHFSGFTADEWRNWTLVYSLICLKGVIGDVHYVVWSLFVKACVLLFKRVMTRSEVNESHSLLIVFCKRFEILYGKDKCTMNMHLHQHIRNCVFDFGPPHVFWCFAFERMNGVLGSYANNNQLIEIQMMRKFMEFNQSNKLHLNHSQYSFSEALHCASDRGSLMEVKGLTETKLLLPCTQLVLSTEERDELHNMFSLFYPNYIIVDIDSIKSHHKSALLRGKSLMVESKKLKRSCFVIVSSPDEGDSRVCEVNELLTINAIVLLSNKKKKISVELVKVKYFKEHTEEHSFARPVKVLCPEYDNNMCEFVPLCHIKSRSAMYEDTVKFKNGNDRAVIIMPFP